MSGSAPTLRRSGVHDCPIPKGKRMEWHRIQGSWKQYMGSARLQWGRISVDELDLIGGRRDTLAGQIQEVYGITKAEADRQVEFWRGQQKEMG